MATIHVEFSTLLQNHPYHYEVKALLNGPVKSISPPCCVQVSYALNKSGSPVVNEKFWVPEMGRYCRFVGDAQGSLYLIEVCDMGAYLDGYYGVAENHRGSKEQMVEKIKGRTGIIRFGKAHIDLWEGERFHQENTKTMPDNWAKGASPVIVWDRPSVKAMGIFFWEVGAVTRHYHHLLETY